MTLTQIIYNILDTSVDITIPNIYAGFANEDKSARDGLLTFFLLPSPGANFTDGTSVSQYQFDIWDKDIYQAEVYKEEVIKALLGLAGWYDEKPLIFVMNSDLGATYDMDGDIWHYPVIFDIKWVR